MKRLGMLLVLVIIQAIIQALFFPDICIHAAADSFILPNSLVEIKDEAFYGDTTIGKVVIPEGTKTIGKLAFAYSGVTEIVLPDSLESIAIDAFWGCSSLETVNASCELIARLEIASLFADTPWLIASGDYDKNVSWHVVSDGALYITGSGTLSGDSQPWYEYLDRITCVNICTGITTIDGPAFSGCSAITACSLPEGLTEIKNDTFRECLGLVEITLPSSMKVVGDYAFYGCGNLERITLNKNLEHIGQNAFAHNSALQNLMLPASLQSIVPTAFYASSNLAAFDLMSENAYYAEVDGVLYSADMKTLVLCPPAYSGTFVIPEGVTEIGECAFQCCCLSDVVFPDSVTTIGVQAFSNCRALQSITVGSNVAVIKSQAFETCTELCSVNLSASVSVIENHAFADCYSLSAINVAEGNTVYSSADGVLFESGGEKLIFCPKQYSGSFICPDGTVEIAGGAFSSCTNMSDITLPAGLKVIGEGAFNLCSAVSINIPDSVEEIGDNAFLNSDIVSISIPKSVSKMGNFAFASCWKMETIILEEGLESISYGAFYDCTAVETIDIPSSITSIGLSAFGKCSNLESINVLSTNTVYSSNDGILFNIGSTKLIQYPAGRKSTEYSIPNATIRIECFAFDYCDALVSISIPESVTEIGIKAINYCPNLQEIKFGGTQAQWAAILWDPTGNWIAEYDPQEFIDFMNSIVEFN